MKLTRSIVALTLLLCAGTTVVAQTVKDSNRLALYDWRSVPTSPGDYSFSLQGYTKYASVLNLANTGNDFVALLGLRAGLTDNGGRGHELAFGSNGNIYQRSGFIATGWEGWHRLLNEDVNGNVGIGTIAPSYRLHVIDTFTSAYTPTGAIPIPSGTFLSIQNAASKDGSNAFISFIARNTGGTNNSGYIGIVSNAGAISSDLVFGQRNGSSSYAESMRIAAGGNVGIGTSTPGSFKLAVEGTIGARKVKVTSAAWADFVFEPGYNIRSLPETEAFIKQNKHLPDVPTAAEVARDGQDLGEMNKILLQKIEELTLQVIELNKKVEKLEAVKK